LEPPLCVVSNWIIRVYTILVWNIISGSSNLDICCYHCLILTIIFHLKVLINFFFFFFFIIIIITIIVVVIVLLLTIIYTINLPVVRPRSCRVIYYFYTPTLGRRHQSFGRVTHEESNLSNTPTCTRISYLTNGPCDLKHTVKGVPIYKPNVHHIRDINLIINYSLKCTNILQTFFSYTWLNIIQFLKNFILNLSLHLQVF